MNTRKQRYNATFPRGRFNDHSTCKVIEDGHAYFIEYRLVRFLKHHHNGSIKAFIETLLFNMRRSDPNYATSLDYVRLQALLTSAV